ncbi:MAG: discoidin domain-containing protein, partial [Alloprevotella sp.]|nr:discoidin domain-containing protein [Alloprevotella sp.]
AVDASTEYQALLDAAKAELNATIEEATTNYNSIAVSFNPATSVNLTADGNLFSNAEQTKTGTGDARAYLSNLTDGNANTFFHSSYEQTKASFPNEYHYLQVNLKQAVDVIGFYYTTRNLVDGPHPTVIEVQCSSDGLNFVSAATFTKDADGLPTDAGASYFSYDRPIGLPFSSRYIRYVVKENHRSNALTSNGYPFFTMAEFGMLNFTFEDASVSKEPLDVEWYNRVYRSAITAAQNVYNDKDYSHMLVSDVNAANAALAKVTAAYERYVANKSNPLYTKNPASPTVFAIKSGRSGTNYTGNWYYVFKPFEGGKIKIESFAETAYEENLYCYWYLMSDALTGYCRLYPYAETSKPMGYITVGDGENKLTNVSTTTNYVGDLYELVLTSDGNFPYALKPAGKSTYVSNYNGKDAYMGFYNVLDNGTKFATVSVTALENIESLRTLHEAYKATPTSRPADSKFGITLNKLNEEYKRVYDEAYPSAGNILTTAAKTTTAENLATTTTKVESLPSLFHMNQPATGKFYRFKSVKHNDKRLRSDKSGNTLKCGDVNDNGRESIFYLTADNKLVAYVEGQYIGLEKSALADVDHAGYVTAFRCGIDYASYTIATMNGSTQRAIYCGGATWDRGNLTNNAHTDSGYDWVIEEVSWLPVGVNTTAGYGTLYSPVALEQSYGRIKAYTGKVADGVLKLTPVEGTIPQNTPVIFEYVTGAEGAEGNQNVFLGVQADVEGDAYANNGTNGYLSGQFVTTAKAADASIYTLQNKSTHGIGMYKYIGDNIKAFRAYLPYTAPAGGNALRIVFDDVTTGIEGIEVNDGGKTAIYDLSGRRVSRMTKGLYIVNGKKTLIK